MNPPPGTTWRDWDAVCPYCGCGFACSNGLEFERILRTHECRGTDAA